MIYYQPFSLEYQNDLKELIVEAFFNEVFGLKNGISKKDENLIATIYLWFCLSEASYGTLVIQDNHAKGLY